VGATTRIFWDVGERCLKRYRCLPNSMQSFLRLTSYAPVMFVFLSSIVANGGCAECRKVGRVPAASQCLDEKRTRVHTPLENVDGIQFISK